MKIFKNQVIKDIIFSIIICISAFSLCTLIRIFDEGDIYISMIFIFSVFLISRYTKGYFYGLTISILGVVSINYFFTYPYNTFNMTMNGYPITIVSMLLVSVITSAMTSQMSEKEKIKAIANKEQMRSNLLRAVSHDLRTPLTSIMGSAGVINENVSKLDENEIKELSKEIISDSEWLIRMVENLLSITKLDYEDYKLEKTSEIAEEVAMEAVSKIKKRYSNVNISIEIPNEILFVSVDFMLISQVIINLVENSIRHGKATEIIISVSTENDYISFSVKDNGKGISELKTSKEFSENINFLSNNDNDKTKNMGIGLNVCKTIIKAHNGKLLARNNKNNGAEFKFLLPKN